jgi:hypothetical protein
MVIGSVLLQPRKVAFTPAPPAAAILEDVLALGVRLLWDHAHGGTCAARLQSALEIAVGRIVDHVKSGEAAALAKLGSWMKPFLDRVDALGQPFGGAGALDAGDKLLGLIVDVLGGATTDELARHLEFLLKVLHDDLGLTNTFIDDQIGVILDEMATQLRSVPPEADLGIRENRFEIVALIRRIRREIDGQFTMPPINVDRLAGPALGKLRELSYDSFVTNVATVGKSAQGGLGLAGVFGDTLPFSLGFSGGVGAAAPAGGELKRAWYATWVEGKESTWHIEAPDPPNAPVLKDYSFKHAKAPAMEALALHSKWITTLIDGILVAIIGYRQGRGVYSITTVSMCRDALYTALAPLADFAFPKWLDVIFNLVATALCSLEGRALRRFDGFLYLFRFVFRFGGTSLPVDKLRDLILSIVTLYNHDRGVTPTPKNRNNDGVIQFCMTLLGPLLHAGIMPHNFFSLNGGYPSLIAAIVGGALGISMLSFFIGFFVSVMLAGEPPELGPAAGAWAWGLLLQLPTFIGFWFLLNDGKTNDGKRGDKAVQGKERGEEVTFLGYQPNGTSPYLLPFVGEAECVQGNHGIWSHNSVIGQTFSYDFSMAIGQDVLCMRDGVVVKIKDDTDDGDHDQDGNHIVVRHTTKDTNHDLSVGGADVFTYATYYHSQKDSIKVVANLKVGDNVVRGQKLASCNSTGMSRFNHVHIQVNPEKPAPLDPADPNKPDYRDRTLTIPFVFKDVSDDGVPSSRKVYDSQNVKTP